MFLVDRALERAERQTAGIDEVTAIQCEPHRRDHPGVGDMQHTLLRVDHREE